MRSHADRSFAVVLVAVAFVALAVRVAFVIAVDPKVPPVSDASAYHLLANNMADGRGYIRPFDFKILHVERPTAEYPPLFPALLAVPSLLGVKSVESQRIFVCFVGAGAVVLIGLLGRRVGGAIVGLVAAALGALYPMLFQSDGILMAESLFVVLVAAILLLAYRAAEAPTPARFALLGLASGVSALARAEGLVFAFVLVIPLAIAMRALTLRRRVLLAAIAILVSIGTVAPWAVRNAVRLHAFVPISNNMGTAIDGANCNPTYYGAHIGLWRETFSQFGPGARHRRQAVACFEGFDIAERGFEEARVADFHRRSGVTYARQHVARVPLVMAVRWLRTWGLWAPRQQVNFETLEGRPQRWEMIGTIMYWVLLPLAILGTALLVRRRARVWPLLSTTVVVSITTVLTYGQQRFRVAAEPAILALAAVALVAVARRVRQQIP